MGADPISLTLLGITGVTGLLGLKESRESRKDERKARKVEARRGRLQAGRQAVEQVRKAQVARAEVIQSGENQGVADSSAVSGGASSVQSQAGGNIGFAQQLFNLQQSATRLRESASLHQGKSQAFGQLSRLSANFESNL